MSAQSDKMGASRYGTLPTVAPPKKEEVGLGQWLLVKAFVAMTICGLVLLGASIGLRTSGAESPTSQYAKGSKEWKADVRRVHDVDWPCSDFDDDETISPEACGLVDRMMCQDHCTSQWCQDLCGASCVKGEGALCAYKLLSDLAGTCDVVHRMILAANSTVANELTSEASSSRIDHDRCRPLADPRVIDPDADRLIDPRNKQGYPMCDHHAWCAYCAGSVSCEEVVPKARAPERVESGGCAAASLGRIVSICDEAGLLETSRIAGQPTRLRKIYYINCDSASDRHELQEDHLARLGVPYERFSCVSGNTIAEVLETSVALRYDAASRHLRSTQHFTDESTRTHTIGTWLSHYALFDRIARVHADDPDGLYLVLEDDVVLDPRFSIADVDRAALSLPSDWAYASLNVHESYCREDRVNDDWFVKRARLDASLFDSERIDAGHCTPITKDDEWHNAHILYLSAAAQLLRPATALRVTEWLDRHPIYHVDAILRTPNASTFPAFQFKENIFVTVDSVSETRVAPS